MLKEALPLLEMKFALLATAIGATNLLPAWADVEKPRHLESEMVPSNQAADQTASIEEDEMITPDTIFPVAPGSFSTCDSTGLLSQTESSVVQSSVACVYNTSPRTSTAQKTARCYSLANEGCTGARIINSVTFGVWGVYSRDNVPVDLKVNIYKDSGCLTGNPTTGGELIASVDTQVTPEDNLSLKTVEICSATAILPSEAIRVEVEQVEDGLDEFTFWPGHTVRKEASGPSYTFSTCSGFVFQDWADDGFPEHDFILDVQTTPAPANMLATNYWIPQLDKPGLSCESKRLKIPDHGEFTCLPIGEGICRDNGGKFGTWRFGIEEVETPPCELAGQCPISAKPSDTFPVLIGPSNIRYPITGTTFTQSDTGETCKNGYGEAVRGCNFAGTTHICISENIESDPGRYSNERPYMFFYNEKTQMFLYQIVCDGIGEEGKLPELKMVNQEDLAHEMYVKYPVDIVKFKKGATPYTDDSNELWKLFMDWNGFEDPETRRRGKLAPFIGVAHPNLCKEYVSATSKACWKEGVDCDDGSVETPEAYQRSDCDLKPTSAPSSAPSSSPSCGDNTPHYVACGRSVGSTNNICTQSTTVAFANDRYYARCCADSDIANPGGQYDPFRRDSRVASLCMPSTTHAASRIGATCSGAVTYCEAVEYCDQIPGSRLCTLEELESQCTAYTGCGYDSRLIWSSTEANGSVVTRAKSESSIAPPTGSQNALYAPTAEPTMVPTTI